MMFSLLDTFSISITLFCRYCFFNFNKLQTFLKIKLDKTVFHKNGVTRVGLPLPTRPHVATPLMEYIHLTNKSTSLPKIYISVCACINISKMISRICIHLVVASLVFVQRKSFRFSAVYWVVHRQQKIKKVTKNFWIMCIVKRRDLFVLRSVREKCGSSVWPRFCLAFQTSMLPLCIFQIWLTVNWNLKVIFHLMLNLKHNPFPSLQLHNSIRRTCIPSKPSKYVCVCGFCKIFAIIRVREAPIIIFETYTELSHRRIQKNSGGDIFNYIVQFYFF